MDINRTQRRWADGMREIPGRQWIRSPQDRDTWQNVGEAYVQESISTGWKRRSIRKTSKNFKMVINATRPLKFIFRAHIWISFPKTLVPYQKNVKKFPTGTFRTKNVKKNACRILLVDSPWNSNWEYEKKEKY